MKIIHVMVNVPIQIKTLYMKFKRPNRPIFFIINIASCVQIIVKGLAVLNY